MSQSLLTLTTLSGIAQARRGSKPGPLGVSLISRPQEDRSISLAYVAILQCVVPAGRSKWSIELSIETDLLSSFIQRLNERDELREDLVATLRQVLTRTRLPRADELVLIISEATGETVA